MSWCLQDLWNHKFKINYTITTNFLFINAVISLIIIQYLIFFEISVIYTGIWCHNFSMWHSLVNVLERELGRYISAILCRFNESVSISDNFFGRSRMNNFRHRARNSTIKSFIMSKYKSIQFYLTGKDVFVWGSAQSKGIEVKRW